MKTEPTRKRIDLPCVLVVEDTAVALELETRLMPFPVLRVEGLIPATEHLITLAPFVTIVGGNRAKDLASCLAELAKAMMSELVTVDQIGSGEIAANRVEALLMKAGTRRARASAIPRGTQPRVR
jgi:hypothetical protein